MVRWVRLWLVRRRIDRMLREVGFGPATRSVFTGNVRIKETKYPEGTSFSVAFFDDEDDE